MIKNLVNFVKSVSPRQILKENRKLIHINNHARNFPISSKLLIFGSSVALIGGVYCYSFDKNQFNIKIFNEVLCSSTLKCQDSVFSQTKKHALYLTIHLEPNASVKDILKIATNLKHHIDVICPKDLMDEENEILAGIGFGPNFLEKARPSVNKKLNFAYHDRKGQHGTMPSTGGDIFIHAKCDELSKLFELTQAVIKKMPANSVEKYEDIYGWVYRNGRDLSGFIDGTENAADEEHRHQIAVNESTGGSFVITQKWIHQHNVIDREKESTLEGWVGRKRSDSTEIKNKTITSHVARMTGGPNFEQKKTFEILRQSQPFGTLSGENGLFFIAYSSNVEALDYMLNRMVGATEDGQSDDIMRISKCVKSTYWYFPGEKELEQMGK